MGRALTSLLGEGHHVELTADAGPARRYADFLSISRGARRLVVGTRAAGFAPVHDLGLVAIWDDGDDLHAEPRAPYPHTRETLLLRGEREGAAVLVGGLARTVEAEYLLRSGWAAELSPPRAVLRQRVTISIAGAADQDLERDPHSRGARVPRQVHDAIRDGLRSGPVLVQTPRTGYAAALACERCRTPARCATCSGPLQLSDPTSPPSCRWCAAVAEGWACPDLRAPRPARAGARGRPHRRGARTLLPQHPRAHLQRGPGAQRRRRRAGDRGGDPGCRAGGRRRLRHRGPARHLAAAGRHRPAHRRGGAAALVHGGRPGATGRSSRRGGGPGPPGAPGTGPLGHGGLRGA